MRRAEIVLAERSVAIPNAQNISITNISLPKYTGRKMLQNKLITMLAKVFYITDKAKGSLGCWIVLAEWAYTDNGEQYIKTVKSAHVDGKQILPDVFYTLIDGKFVQTE